MRILFVGAVPENDYDRRPRVEKRRVGSNQDLWAAAAELGRVAAERGHTLMVGSERPTTIDHYVVADGLMPVAAANSDRNFFLEVWRPDDQKRPFEGSLPANVSSTWFLQRSGLSVDSAAVHGRSDRATIERTHLWSFAHQAAVSSADVVIAMGGGLGTEKAVYAAEAQGVPVLPVATFDGGAGRAYESLASSFIGLTGGHHLSAEWGGSRAGGIIALAEAVGRHSYFLSYSHQQKGWCDFVNLALLERRRTVLRDRSQLRAGAPVQSKLFELIGRAETFVLLWSKSSERSQWCMKELEVAKELNRQGLPPHRIVLLMRDKTPLPAGTEDDLQLNARTRSQTEKATNRLVAEESSNA